jgi:hypothetical protein
VLDDVEGAAADGTGRAEDRDALGHTVQDSDGARRLKLHALGP